MSYNVARVRFLIVDDHHPMQIQFKQLLRILGASDIETAYNGEQAIAHIRTFRPHLVLTDQEMSPITGEEFARWIRTDKESPDQEIPIIMTSAYSEPARVIAARDAGVNEFLVKPVSLARLDRRLSACIESERPFVRSLSFVGPCRRRAAKAGFNGPYRRATDPDHLKVKQAEPELDIAEIDI